MQVVGIIPARYASSRLPGKPLSQIAGKTLIQRVYEQAKQATALNAVYVATDSPQIMQAVANFGGHAILTHTNHQSGTERCAEAIEKLPSKPNIVINIQGDEPFINPEQINQVVQIFTQNPDAQLATLIRKITEPEVLLNPNHPKVVINEQGQAIYFSRQAIPFLRNHPTQNWLQHHVFYQHVGIYGYTAQVLQQIVQLPPSPLEQAELLEQLRWIAHGWPIFTQITSYPILSVDTPDDLAAAIEYAQANNL